MAKQSVTKTDRKSEKAAKGASSKKPANPKNGGAGATDEGTYRIKVRMYRQGLGDCFLITLPTRTGPKPYYAVIDCGVILGTSDANNKMARVVQDIYNTTGGHLDLLAVTHEHWDHVSGFAQAQDLWTKFDIEEVWLGWTEDPGDSLGKELSGERMKMCEALRAAALQMRMAGATGGADDVTSMVEFFGATGGNTTRAALDFVKKLSKNIRYRHPNDAPVELPGTGIKVYILGPPHDEKMIKKVNPSKKDPETYGMAAMALFLDDVGEKLLGGYEDGIFSQNFQIPTPAAQGMGFFQSRYWGADTGSPEKDQGWRRIDSAWLDASSSMALALDSATNNTSLVLAFELEGGEILLFAADAQVGNWLSWHDLSWTVGSSKVTGPDLLSRVTFYKVGHHGSHNATLRELGLEEMKGLKLAFLPVDQQMAKKKRWGQMPFNDLLSRLDVITGNNVVRIDQTVPAGMKTTVVAGPDDLFYEAVL